jgi:REP element-mobilizing transposase RayT
MTQARRQLVDPSQAQMFHCIQRCVRRAWLCGLDPYTRQSFEHRKAWVERRIFELGEIFACGIYGYAIMSNHLHLVLHMSPATSKAWSADEVARRWVKLYPARTPELCEQKVQAILAAPELIQLYRERLTNLSWLMKSLSEPIARRANTEDKVNGRFWQGRFTAQALLSEKALMAAMTYVDLNPIRADIASSVTTSRYTSINVRAKQLRRSPALANEVLTPLIGTKSHHVRISEADYLELVDFTGREMHPGKRGKIAASEPKALTKLGLDKTHWTMRVEGIGSGYWRVVGEVKELIDKAKEIGQRTLFGIGFAKLLKAI